MGSPLSKSLRTRLWVFVEFAVEIFGLQQLARATASRSINIARARRGAQPGVELFRAKQGDCYGVALGKENDGR